MGLQVSEFVRCAAYSVFSLSPSLSPSFSLPPFVLSHRVLGLPNAPVIFLLNSSSAVP